MHRLIAITFLKQPKGCDIVNHKDGNKLNNNLSNLEWTTRGGNAQHYEKNIKPKNIAVKKEKKHEDAVARLKIIKHANAVCSDNIDLYQSIITAALKDCKLI